MVDQIKKLDGIVNLPQANGKVNNTKLQADKGSIFRESNVNVSLDNASVLELERALGVLPTPKQKAAREKLDGLVSSTGMTYKDAKEIVSKLKEKYANDKRYQSNFKSEQPTDGRKIYIMPKKDFDPYKIPEPDKSNYFEAIAVMQEIEKNNSALVQQTGLKPTESPSTNYSKDKLVDILY